MESLAKKKGIAIVEPFSNTLKATDHFCLLGPSTDYYEELLESFRPAEELAPGKSFLEKVAARAEKALKWVAETWSGETLVEPDEEASSAENNSSVILLFRDGVRNFLFTSDAGVPALTRAADYAASVGTDLKAVGALQVPHHGSKRNVGPAILDRLLGPKNKEEKFSKVAIVSASKGGDPTHPSRRVVNAFMRRGARVYQTKGKALWHHSKDAPARDQWGNATALPFYEEVEE